MKQKRNDRQGPNNDISAASRQKQLSPAERHYQRVPNFDLIPPEYRSPRRKVLVNLVLLLMIIAVASFVPGLHRGMSVRQDAIADIRMDVVAIEAELEEITYRRDRAAEFLANIRGIKEEYQYLLIQRQGDWRRLGLNPLKWHKVVAAVFHSRLFGIQLSSVEVHGMELVVSGIAPDYGELLRFHAALLADPTISRIMSLSSELAEIGVSFSLEVELGE